MAGMLAGLTSCDRGGQPAATQPAGPVPSAARPVLAASVFPLADLVRRVAGDRWEVVCLLPPGRNPHGYSLRPAEGESLARARVLFTAGMGLDGWAIRAAHGINTDCKVIVLTEVLGLTGGPGQEEPEASATRPAEDEGHDTHGSDGGMDPHIWLDPLLAVRIGQVAAEELSGQDPAGQGVYRRNLADLKRELDVLDVDYRTGLASCRTRELVVFHPGYGYLARRYGLHQVPITAGTEAKAAQVQEVIDLVKREHIRAIYREPQFESRWVGFISRATGAKVLVLDPQGHAAKAGYDSYFAMMRSNLAALKEGLDCGS